MNTITLFVPGGTMEGVSSPLNRILDQEEVLALLDSEEVINRSGFMKKAGKVDHIVKEGEDFLFLLKPGKEYESEEPDKHNEAAAVIWDRCFGRINMCYLPSRALLIKGNPEFIKEQHDRLTYYWDD